MKREQILIAGAGQLGSRYLQGLAKYPRPLDIWLQDPSLSAIQTAIERWGQTSAENSKHRIKVLDTSQNVPEVFDVVIVSTNANIRCQVVRTINKQFNVHNWILEKVLAQSEEDVDEIVNIIGDTPAWVNTPMHLWSLYSNLKAEFSNHEPINAIIKNFEGLACSSIHFIDFIARCNKSKVTSIDTENLYPEWIESKRPGFMEVNGELAVNFSDGSRLKLIGNRDAAYHYTATISCAGETWEVDTEEGIAKSDLGRIIRGRAEYQSELTFGIVESILTRGMCGLPTLPESAHQHRILLAALLKHYIEHKGKDVTHIPIT